MWREVVELGEVCARLAEVVGTTVQADVAVLWDYQAGWACDEDSHPSSLVRYGTDAHAIHAALRERGVAADVVHPSADLSSYRLVVVPTLYACTDAAAAAVRSAAEGGASVSSRSSPASSTRTTTSASAATPARSATCWACGSRSSIRSRQAPR